MIRFLPPPTQRCAGFPSWTRAGWKCNEVFWTIPASFGSGIPLAKFQIEFSNGNVADINDDLPVDVSVQYDALFLQVQARLAKVRVTCLERHERGNYSEGYYLLKILEQSLLQLLEPDVFYAKQTSTTIHDFSRTP
jgi:hypothetical protein